MYSNLNLTRVQEARIEQAFQEHCVELGYTHGDDKAMVRPSFEAGATAALAALGHHAKPIGGEGIVTPTPAPESVTTVCVVTIQGKPTGDRIEQLERLVGVEMFRAGLQMPDGNSEVTFHLAAAEDGRAALYHDHAAQALKQLAWVTEVQFSPSDRQA